MAKQLTLGETRSAQRTWLVPGIAVLAVAASAHSLVALFSSSGWYFWYLAAIAGYWLLSCLAHRFIRNSVIAEVVSLTITALGAVLVLARIWTPDLSWNPRDLLWAAQQTLLAGIDAIRTQWVPLNPRSAIVATLGLLVIALAAAADTLARRQDAMLVSLLPAAMLWLLPSFLGTPVHVGAIAVMALCALLLLLLTGRRRRSTAPNAAGFVVAGVAAALLFTPLVANLDLTNRFELPSSNAILDSGGQLDVGDDLGAQSTAIVYQMTTTSPQGLVLRVNTAEEFRGGSWHFPQITDPGYAITDDLWLPEAWPLLFSDQPTDITTVEIQSLSGNLLPIPAETRMLGGSEALPRWHFYVDNDVMRVPGGLSRGMSYQITTMRDLPNPDKLRGADLGTDASSSTTLLDTAHDAELTTLAQEITQNATTPYEQAMALQQWLAVEGGFTYSETLAPGDSIDPVWHFLETKQGYCVQFASAFAMLARSLDIPTRVALGYLPGDLTAAGIYEVTGLQFHTWPEVYFADYGWIRFEPTPASHTGEPPLWADPNFIGTAAPVDPIETATPVEPSPTQGEPDPDPSEIDSEDSPSPSVPATSSPTSVSPSGSAQSPNAQQSDGSVTTWLIGALLLLAIGAAGFVGWRQRKEVAAQRAAELAVATQWQDLGDGLVARGFSWSAERTETQLVAGLLDEVRERTGSMLSENSQEQLADLAQAVILQRYGRPARAADVEQPEVAQQVLAEIDLLVSPDPDGDPSAQPADQK